MEAMSGMGDAMTPARPAALDDVVFDCCGVLVDWHPRLALEGLYPAGELDGFFADDDRCGFMYFDDLHDRGMDYDRLCDACEEEYGARLGAMMRAYAWHVDLTLTGTVPDMTALLADLKACGVGVWCLTNWGRDVWPVLRDRFPGLFGMMDGVVVSGVEGVAKPDAAAFDLAVARFGLDRARTAFVDDSPYNVDGAIAAGLQAVRFSSAADARRWLAGRGALHL